MIRRLDAVHASAGEVHQARRPVQHADPLTQRAGIPLRPDPRTFRTGLMTRQDSDFSTSVVKLNRQAAAKETAAAGNDDSTAWCGPVHVRSLRDSHTNRMNCRGLCAPIARYTPGDSSLPAL